MTEMSGADMVVQALVDLGVDTVFGYPGGAVLPIYDALYNHPTIKHILVRHEQAATHAAEGYARSTGKPGVVLVTSGPGATNAVTGITDALLDSIPMVVLTGQVSTALIGTARENGSGEPLTLDLTVTPAPNILFPGGSIAECAGTDESCPFVSGYTVPGLRVSATGSMCIAGTCEDFADAQSYHDHNWGVWHGVSWDWGATRAGAYTLLYGRVAPPDSAGNTQPFFVYLTDSLGFRALFRPHEIAYEDGRTISVNGREVRVPSRAVLQDARGADTLRVELTIEDAIGSDTRTSLIERGDAADAKRISKPYFIQMKGHARISGRVGGSPVAGEGTGFFETYR